MNRQLDADIAVIGGGPAGSAAATMLARQGWRVVLLERERFPREHVGESLLPASMPVLEELGAMAAVQEAGFLPKYGATMVWGRDPEPWSWYFKETSQRYPHAFQVWRPRFDQILLENARANGVDVREGCRVSGVALRQAQGEGGFGQAQGEGGFGQAQGEGDFDGAGATSTVRYVSDTAGRGELSARFVVDASGQAALLARQLGARRWDSFFQNLAVYAYFEGAEPLASPDENNIFIEAYEHGWFWTIPLHTGQSSVGAVVDNQTGQEGIRRLGATAFLSAQLAQTRLTARRLRNATLSGEPRVVRDWSYSAERLAGPGYALTGDSACFVDPLFSSGVHLALMSGVMAAAYATTALKAANGGDAQLSESASHVYQELYYKEYNQFREMARLFYASNLTSDSYFWEARRILEQDGGQSEYSPRHSFIQAVAGQPPRGYERAVLERGEAPAGFTGSVRAVESERARRAEWLAALHADPQRNWLLPSVPRLAPGATVARKPVLAEGEFVWGATLSTPSHPEGAPCSPLVAAVARLADGQTTVAAIIARLSEGLDDSRKADLQAAVTRTIEILYVDGAVEELRLG